MQKEAEATLQETSNTQSSTSSPETIEGAENGSILVNDLNHSKIKNAENDSIVVNDLNHNKVKDAKYKAELNPKKAIRKLEGEDVDEDPTLDEYHNMKDKKEDEDSTTKPTSESMRVDHFANLLIHAELEYRYKTLESCQKWREKGAR